MKPGHFLSELQRRHVLRVVGAYAFAAWVAVEVYTTIQPILFETAEWSNRLVVILALCGFPVVFALAWIFDITPQGVRRTEALAASEQEGAAGRSRRVLSARATGFFGLGILVALVALAAYAGFDPHRPATASTEAPVAIRSVAVLPFENLSGDPDQDFLSDGIAEELLNRLAQVRDLKVPARTSSFAFRGSGTDVREIGRRLGVQAVLEGSVRREGDQVRVRAQLVDVSTGYQIWADTFDGVATHVFALQDEIGAAIMDRLKLRFAAAPEAGERGTSNPRAYELYLLGMQRWHYRTDRDLRQALGYFSSAVEEDGQFALAHAALAQTYAVLPAYGSYPADSAVMRGSAAAAQAIALDPSLAEAYAAMGQIVQNFEWDLHAAQRYYQRALEYSSSATAHQWYAETLLMLGRHDEAVQHIERTIALDALSPIGLYVGAYILTARGRTDEALAAWRDLLRLHPDFELGLTAFAYSAVAAGRSADAVGALLRLAAAAPARAPLCNALAEALQNPAARRSALAALRSAGGIAASERAAWHMVLGDRAGALTELERGFRQRADVNLPFVLVHPLMKPLRSEPRFRAIIDDIGIGFGA